MLSISKNEIFFQTLNLFVSKKFTEYRKQFEWNEIAFTIVHTALQHKHEKLK
jgi:hypothetical protein